MLHFKSSILNTPLAIVRILGSKTFTVNYSTEAIKGWEDIPTPPGKIWS
jgi:hypothetical protein